ncbi:unnamed protein product, partial [Ixodes pacificus]
INKGARHQQLISSGIEPTGTIEKVRKLQFAVINAGARSGGAADVTLVDEPIPTYTCYRMDRLKWIRLTGEQDTAAIFTTLVSVVILVAVAVWVRKTRKQKQAAAMSPPGPWGLPLLGYLPFLGKKHHIFFRDLSCKYGPVISVRLGAVNVVVLNSYQSIREGFSKKQLLARNSNVVLEQAGVL